MARITSIVARVLAEQAYEQIERSVKEKKVSIPKKVKQSEHYKRALQLMEKRNKLESEVKAINEKLTSARNQIEKTFKVEAYTGGRSIDLRYRPYTPDIKKLTREILVANQMDGVEAKDAVNHMVKKFS